MYEKYFDMEHTPFSRNLPVDRLYASKAIEDAIGRLKYSIDRQGFSVSWRIRAAVNLPLSGY